MITPMMFQKLKDPHGLVDSQTLAKMEEKISACLTGMYRKPGAGGNPFLFTLSIAKSHYLAADEEIAKAMNAGGKEVPLMLRCPTAGTDGRSFFWHPDFLGRLTSDELPTVMEHESLHVAFDHPHRMMNANYTGRAYAIDYVVNSCIEKNHKLTQRKGQLWGGNLGIPVSLQALVDHIDGKTEEFKKDEPRIFADPLCYGRSPESIYDEIMEHWDKSPRKCGKCGSMNMDPKTGKPKRPPCASRPACPHDGMCCPKCGARLVAGPGGMDSIPMDGMPSAMDSHMDMKVTRQEAQNEIMRAASHTKAMRGMVPSEVESMLGELMKPVVLWTDFVFSDCMRRCREDGLRNDWSRPRKRSLASSPSLYLPSRFSHTKRWLALLDTSGSMSDKDMAFVTSQLRVLCAKGSDGIIVPCDARPHWDHATSVKSIENLKHTKVAGRGGTVFDEFFRDYRKKLGDDFDAIIILTDGDCGHIPLKLRPPVPVTWVLTHIKEGWEPSFGRTAPLRVERV